MDLGLDETQSIIRSSARDFLARSAGPSYTRAMESDERGFTDEIWRAMAEMGWLGMIVPESWGGAGMRFTDLAVLLEEMGAAAFHGPFFSTAVIGASALSRHAGEELRRVYLPRLVDGDAITSLAVLEEAGAWTPQGMAMTAERVEDGWRLNGEKRFVRGAHVADFFIVSARSREIDEENLREGITVFFIAKDAPGRISLVSQPSVSDDRFHSVYFEDVLAPSEAVLGLPGDGWRVLDDLVLLGAAGECAEMLGGARAVLEMTVEYAKQRAQFARPIGAFQAIQHLCADLATQVRMARNLTYRAAWRISEDLDASREVAIAKSWLSCIYPEVCARAHQAHGAVGFTEEHDLQLYTRHAHSSRVAFGDPKHHQRAIVDPLGL